MANFIQMRDRLKAFKFNEVIMQTMVECSDQILDANRSQLKKGFKSTGERVGVYANPAYEREKVRMNPEANGWVDLTYTGDFTRELTLRPVNTVRANIYSQDEKAKKLSAKYGDAIYGVSAENIGKINQEGFQDKLADNVKEKLDL